MPITQDRFYAIIRTARAFYDQLYYVRNTALEELALIESGHRHSRDAIDNIVRAIHSAPIDPHMILTLGAEEKHHQLTRRKNQRTARRQTERRRDAGILPRPHAAAKLDDIIEVEGEEYVAPSLESINEAIATIDITGAPDDGPANEDANPLIIKE